jgi:hypothetical protein
LTEKRQIQIWEMLAKRVHYEPQVFGGVVEVSPLEDVQEGIAIWKSSLVRQFQEKKHLPFFLVKKVCGYHVAKVW